MSFYRRILNKLKFLVACKPRLCLRKFFAKVESLQKAEIIALRRDCSSFLLREVAESSRYKTVSPNFSNNPSLVIEGSYESINAYRLRRAVTSAYSPVFSTPRKIIYPDSVVESLNRIQTDTAEINFKAVGLVRSTNCKYRLKRGIHMGGAGSSNWYHYLLEILPKLLLLDRLPPQFKEYPLIMPFEANSISSYRNALKILAKDKDVIFLRRKELAMVGDLIVFNEISSAPYNMHEGLWPVLSDYRQHDGLILEMIARLKGGLLPKISNIKKSNRLFLVRPEGRRDYNQAELVTISTRYGFEPVSPELYSLEEQAALFGNASCVIGASGAAWVGSIFADQQFFGLSWLPPVYREFCSYSSLATLLGHRLNFVECIPDKPLLSTTDAYYGNYTVSPVLFENSLRELFNQMP